MPELGTCRGSRGLAIAEERKGIRSFGSELPLPTPSDLAPAGKKFLARSRQDLVDSRRMEGRGKEGKVLDPKSPTPVEAPLPSTSPPQTRTRPPALPSTLERPESMGKRYSRVRETCTQSWSNCARDTPVEANSLAFGVACEELGVARGGGCGVGRGR